MDNQQFAKKIGGGVKRGKKSSQYSEALHILCENLFERVSFQCKITKFTKKKEKEITRQNEVILEFSMKFFPQK